MLEFLLHGDNWLAVATTSGTVALLALVVNRWRAHVLGWATATSALNLFFGVWIGVMGIGHLQAVTIKTVLGTLSPSTNPWIAIPLGFALSVPGWWLLAHVGALSRQEEAARKIAMRLNAWLVLVLLAAAWQLVFPPALNLALLAWKGKKKESKMSEASA